MNYTRYIYMYVYGVIHMYLLSQIHRRLATGVGEREAKFVIYFKYM